MHAAPSAPSNLQHVQWQTSQQHQNDEAQQPADAQGWAKQEQQSTEHSAPDPNSPLEHWLDDQGIALLPVMAAAALQLAYAALACVRLMKTKVFTSEWTGKAVCCCRTDSFTFLCKT
jgi:hypothetical protein